ncbi:MAG: hypothetical protein ACXVRN_06735 [Solirubrobacteraceae bacterium]
MQFTQVTSLVYVPVSDPVTIHSPTPDTVTLGLIDILSDALRLAAGADTRGIIDDVRLGIADHLGWAVAVTSCADHEVVDRRRIELIEPGLSAAPIHYESARLDVAATAALVAKVRASVVRATSAALDELAAALPAPVRATIVAG